MSNTLMISVTHFFHSNITVEILDTLQFKKLNVSPEKLTKNEQLIISFFTLKNIMDVYYNSYHEKITVQIDKTLQFAHVSKKLNVSLAKLT